jgi:hypothetical protein
MDEYRAHQLQVLELSRGHHWQVDESGLPDLLAYDGDRHNGPYCEACHYSYCVHCEPEGPDEECSKVIDVTASNRRIAGLGG